MSKMKGVSWRHRIAQPQPDDAIIHCGAKPAIIGDGDIEILLGDDFASAEHPADGQAARFFQLVLLVVVRLVFGLDSPLTGERDAL